jgi:hypothetical protein
MLPSSLHTMADAPLRLRSGQANYGAEDEGPAKERDGAERFFKIWFF